MQISLECAIILCLNGNSKSSFKSSASTTNGRFFSLSHFVALQVLKVKNCRIGCCGFSFPLVALHLVRDCEKGTGNWDPRVEHLLPGNGKTPWPFFCWIFLFRLNSFLYACAELLLASHLQDLIYHCIYLVSITVEWWIFFLLTCSSQISTIFHCHYLVICLLRSTKH